MPWKPQHDDDFPTLGWYVLEWMEANLAQPGRMEYEPFTPTQEQADFILELYRLDPKTSRRVMRRSVISRPRGWGKSPLLSALGCVEGMADVVPDGWDAYGQPVGKPWREVLTPWVVFAATTEAQVGNMWDHLLEMLGPSAPIHDNYLGIETMGSQVNLPAGWMLPITSSPDSIKGKPMVYCAADQTELWRDSNQGKKLYGVLRDNVSKISGIMIESPNAFTPGEESVAELTAKAHLLAAEGRAKQNQGILYDHREAPGHTSLMDRDSLREGLRFAYGDASKDPRGCSIHEPPCDPGWVDIERLIDDAWDADADDQNTRSNFLNQITHTSDAWIAGFEWDACRDSSVEPLSRGDAITLGFDGSRGRAKGKPDATALVAARVKDGHVQTLGVWEAPEDKSTWDTWNPSISQIEVTIEHAFSEFNVVGFFADPGKDWRSHINSWEAKYGRKVKIRARRDHPFEWWMTGGRAGYVEQAIEATESAIRHGEMSHHGQLEITRHVLNARRRLNGRNLALAKRSPHSPDKIDAAVAMVLAWAARLEAVAAGVSQRKVKAKVPRRIR